MKERITETLKKANEYLKKNPIITIIIGATIIVLGILIIVACVKNTPDDTPTTSSQDEFPGTVGYMSMSEEELSKLNFSLSNTSQEEIDNAVEYVRAEIDKEAAKPYIVSFEKGNIYASEEATVYFRKRFFLSDYVERYKLTDTYVNKNTVAILAEYTVDYDEAQVPYEDGKTTRAFYLMRNNETQQWITWKEETISVE